MGKPYVSNIEKNAGKLNFEWQNCLRWLLLMQNSMKGVAKLFTQLENLKDCGILKKGLSAMTQYG